MKTFKQIFVQDWTFPGITKTLLKYCDLFNRKYKMKKKTSKNKQVTICWRVWVVTFLGASILWFLTSNIISIHFLFLVDNPSLPANIQPHSFCIIICKLLFRKEILAKPIYNAWDLCFIKQTRLKFHKFTDLESVKIYTFAQFQSWRERGSECKRSPLNNKVDRERKTLSKISLTNMREISLTLHHYCLIEKYMIS